MTCPTPENLNAVPKPTALQAQQAWSFIQNSIDDSGESATITGSVTCNKGYLKEECCSIFCNSEKGCNLDSNRDGHDWGSWFAQIETVLNYIGLHSICPNFKAYLDGQFYVESTEESFIKNYLNNIMPYKGAFVANSCWCAMETGLICTGHCDTNNNCSNNSGTCTMQAGNRIGDPDVIMGCDCSTGAGLLTHYNNWMKQQGVYVPVIANPIENEVSCIGLTPSCSDAKTALNTAVTSFLSALNRANNGCFGVDFQNKNNDDPINLSKSFDTALTPVYANLNYVESHCPLADQKKATNYSNQLDNPLTNEGIWTNIERNCSYLNNNLWQSSISTNPCWVAQAFGIGVTQKCGNSCSYAQEGTFQSTNGWLDPSGLIDQIIALSTISPRAF